MTSPSKIGSQPPLDIFPWPKGWKLTALEDAILAIPAAILSDEEAIWFGDSC
jgi:hypothetical protein